MSVPYEYGLQQLTEHCSAWLQPDGSFGLSNAGLITGSEDSLLVDTLVDLAHTRAMLDGISHVTQSAPITKLVTTHADADHFFGHQLLSNQATIYASAAAAPGMATPHLEQVRAMLVAEGQGGDFSREAFAPFNFSDIEPVAPDITVNERTVLNVGGVAVELIPVPPAHSPGDMLIWVPSDAVLYAGDLLFVDVAPITWAGPVSRWVDVCNFMLSLEATHFVPGHGPVTNADGVKHMRDYLVSVDAHSRAMFDRGLTVPEAARAYNDSRFDNLISRGRLVQNIQNVYRELDQNTPAIRVMEEHAAYEAWYEASQQ